MCCKALTGMWSPAMLQRQSVDHKHHGCKIHSSIKIDLARVHSESCQLYLYADMTQCSAEQRLARKMMYYLCGLVYQFL